MAKKFFNQRVKKSKKQYTKKTLIIAGILLILFVIGFLILNAVNANNKKLKNATIEVREMVGVEVNTDLPDKTTFFNELQNVREKDIKTNLDKLDVTEVGNFEVELKIYGKKFKSILQVVDTVAPELTLKDVSISVGESYKVEDFVESCKDNSNKDCKIEFYDASVDQESNPVDYSSFITEGTYTIQIVASDESGNTTTGSATLTIGKNQIIRPECKHGDSFYDSNTSTLAVDVTENGCALSLDLYKDEAVIAPARSLVASEEVKLNKEFSKIHLNVGNIYINSLIDPILNTTGNGLVGYSVHIEVSIKNSTGQKEVIESYYLNKDGSRKYVVNKYLK